MVIEIGCYVSFLEVVKHCVIGSRTEKITWTESIVSPRPGPNPNLAPSDR